MEQEAFAHGLKSIVGVPGLDFGVRVQGFKGLGFQFMVLSLRVQRFGGLAARPPPLPSPPALPQKGKHKNTTVKSNESKSKANGRGYLCLRQLSLLLANLGLAVWVSVSVTRLES